MATSLHPWGVIFKHVTEHPIFNSVVLFKSIMPQLGTWIHHLWTEKHGFYMYLTCRGSISWSPQEAVKAVDKTCKPKESISDIWELKILRIRNWAPV